MCECAHHQIPGVQGVWRLAPRTKIFRGIDLRFNRGDNGLGDLILHREDVSQIAVVALCPDVAPGGDIVELPRDSHSVAALAHAALDDVADTDLIRNLPNVHRSALVDEGR